MAIAEARSELREAVRANPHRTIPAMYAEELVQHAPEAVQAKFPPLKGIQVHGVLLLFRN
ncbi:MAG: hypothetical protein GY820_09150 [Gammaproteobacteria bacterium]|nr:hypothetical protein [Gammaproteobacteria bacterium]